MGLDFNFCINTPHKPTGRRNMNTEALGNLGYAVGCAVRSRVATNEGQHHLEQVVVLSCQCRREPLRGFDMLIGRRRHSKSTQGVLPTAMQSTRVTRRCWDRRCWTPIFQRITKQNRAVPYSINFAQKACAKSVIQQQISNPRHTKPSA